MKKIRTIVCVVLLCMGVQTAIMVQAAEPVLINNQADLKKLADDVAGGESFEGVTFKLTTNITLNVSDKGIYPNGWTPIGSPLNPFMGSFDGDGHLIKGLVIDDEGTVGLFGSACGGVIENLGLVNVDVKGTESVGALVGSCGSSVKNCFSTGKVSGQTGEVLQIGGLVGDMFDWDTPVSIENCYSQCDVEALGNNPDVAESFNVVIGGLLGAAYQNTIVKNCYASGNVTIESVETQGGQHIGGVVGIADADASVTCSAALNEVLFFNPAVDYKYNDMDERFARIASVPPMGGNPVSVCVVLDDMLGEYMGTPFPFNAALSQNGQGIPAADLQRSDLYSALGWKFGTDAENPWKTEENEWPILWFTKEEAVQPAVLYHEDDKEALRAFLIQKAADWDTDGKYNYERLGLTAEDVATWDTEEAWVGKLSGLIWTNAAPKRLLKIGENNYSPPTPWGSKKLAGTLDLRKCKELTMLYCERNKLESILLTGLTKLGSLYCPTNSLTSLDVSNLSELTYLNCDLNELVELKITGLPKLGRLFCRENKLTELDFTGTTNIYYLYAQENELITLDVSSLLALETLDCSWNNLTELDISKLTKLTSLRCSFNQLSTLNIVQEGLTSFYCAWNKLTSLDLSKPVNLKGLDCGNNQIESLELLHLKDLGYLICEGNKLTSLDLTGLDRIYTLECGENFLTSLDVTGKTKLTRLGCHDNRFKFSTLPPNWGNTPYQNGIYYYGPQDTIQGGILPIENAEADLSSEYIINHVATVYNWFDITEGKKVDINAQVTDDGTGKFTFDASLAGKKLRCEMRNTNFPYDVNFFNNNFTLVYEVSLSGGKPAVPTYTILVPAIMPTGISAINCTGGTTVNEGETFSFTLVYASGYGNTQAIVKVNDVVIHPVAGTTYTITDIKENKTIVVEDASPNPVSPSPPSPPSPPQPPVVSELYKVILFLAFDEAYKDCITLYPGEGEYEISKGESFSFMIYLADDCELSSPEVYVNGELVMPAESVLHSIAYTYSVKVTEALTIEIKGVKRNSTDRESIEGKPEITIAGGLLSIKTPTTQDLRVYTTMGQLYINRKIASGTTVIHLPKGIYIIRMKDMVWKVIILQ